MAQNWFLNFHKEKSRCKISSKLQVKKRKFIPTSVPIISDEKKKPFQNRCQIIGMDLNWCQLEGNIGLVGSTRFSEIGLK